MTRFAMFAALVLASGATAARAEPIADQVVSALTAQGYTRIEVKNRAGEVKVEAVRGNRQLEVVYDAETGEILSQETHPVRAGDDTTPGVIVSGEDRVRGRSEDHRNDDFGRAQGEIHRSDHSAAGHDDHDDDDDSADDSDDRSGSGKDRGRGRGRGSDDDGSDDGDD